jgi:hypothetical protein
MRPAGRADPSEIEAQRGQAAPLGNLGGADHDGVVHVPPVERVGMAQDEPGGRAARGGETPLERGTPGHLEDQGFFHRGEYIRAGTRRKQRVYFERCAASAVCGIDLAWLHSRMPRCPLAVRLALRVISPAAQHAGARWRAQWRFAER